MQTQRKQTLLRRYSQNALKVLNFSVSSDWPEARASAICVFADVAQCVIKRPGPELAPLRKVFTWIDCANLSILKVSFLAKHFSFKPLRLRSSVIPAKKRFRLKNLHRTPDQFGNDKAYPADGCEGAYFIQASFIC